MNISDATFGAVTPLMSGMPFQSPRSYGEWRSDPVLNSSMRRLSSARIALTSFRFSRSQVTHPSPSRASSSFVGPISVNCIDPSENVSPLTPARISLTERDTPGGLFRGMSSASSAISRDTFSASGIPAAMPSISSAASMNAGTPVA